MNFRNKGRGKISKGKKKKRSARPGLRFINQNVITNEKEKEKNPKLKKITSIYNYYRDGSTRLEYKPHPRATFAPQLRLCAAQTTPLTHNHAHSFQ